MKEMSKRKMYVHGADGEPASGLRHQYDENFVPSDAYREDLPDLQNSNDAIQGENVAIQRVGVSNFRVPMLHPTRDGGLREVETWISGTVPLAAGSKGINMSRIMRSFYAFKDEPFTPLLLTDILKAYRQEIGGQTPFLRARFAYPIQQKSLRSGLEGWQYYEVAYSAQMKADGSVRTVIEFDFVYSSACPCSAELAEHARDVRGTYAIPHSQRSKTRIFVELREGEILPIEDLQQHCLTALKTETQVIVKREDEQAFAELNGAHVKFVEDAARLLYEQLNREPRIKDFQIACAHLESLHSHDAVSVIAKGVPGGFTADFDDFGSLVC